jgi:hypothetical protein
VRTAAGTVASSGPVIVISYEFAGAELIGDLLSSSGTFACTSATGIIPLCHSAAKTWQSVEGSSELSPLAAKAIRNTADTLLTVIRAASGGRRWCEISYASPSAASTFLRIFPSATLVCHHRSLSSVYREVKRSFPWGLRDSPLWPFAGIFAGDDLTVVSRYWSAHTEGLLTLEDQHPDACVRIRQEDIDAESNGLSSRLLLDLGLENSPRTVSRQDSMVPVEPSHGAECDTDEPLPLAERLPAQLFTQVQNLHERLGYETGQMSGHSRSASGRQSLAAGTGGNN